MSESLNETKKRISDEGEGRLSGKNEWGGADGEIGQQE